MKTKADAFQCSVNWCGNGVEKPPAVALGEIVEDKKGVRLPGHHLGKRLAEQHQKLRGLHILENDTVVVFCIVHRDLDTAMVKVNLNAATSISLLVTVLNRGFQLSHLRFHIWNHFQPFE